jgi:hypothetical protein
MTKIRKSSKFPIRLALIGLALVIGFGTAPAQSLDIPSKHGGLSFGNSRTFNGLRFNFRDSQVEVINGVNITFWKPRDKDNDDAVVNGLSLGLMPGAGTYHGVQIGLLGVAAAKSLTGISLGLIGMGAGGAINGINVGGIGLGSGGNIEGISLAGIGLGTGENITGISLAGFGLGSGKNIEGISIAGFGLGAGENLTGISVAGFGLGAGKNLSGVNIAGFGLGAGENLTGISVAGFALGAGERLTGLSFAGLAAGSREMIGATFAGGVVGGKTLTGLMAAGGMVHVVKEGTFTGCAVSSFNYIRGSQTGVSIGIVNYAWSVKGIQLGLINIVRDNPAGLKVLPVFNTSF